MYIYMKQRIRIEKSFEKVIHIFKIVYIYIYNNPESNIS
jgi:hypothetical protein